MKQTMKLLFLAGCLCLCAPGVWAQRYQPAQIGWFDDVQRGFATARQQGLPVVLYVRDLFGQGYVDQQANVLRQQMARSRARWRWQRYEQDFFTQPEVAQAVAPFVRVRLALGYQRLDDPTRNLLLTTGVLSDADLVWRTKVLDEPFAQAGPYVDAAGRPILGGLHTDPYGRTVDSTGQIVYRQLLPSATLEELLDREATAVVVLSGSGQVLSRFTRLEPTVQAFTTELTKGLAPYRALAEGRANLTGGRIEPALASFRSLAGSKEPLPDEVRQAAQRELDGLTQKAIQALTDAEKLLTRKDYEAAWAKASPLEKQGLVNVTEAVSGRFQTLKQAVSANAQALYQQSEEKLTGGQLLEAVDLLTRLSTRFAGTDAGTSAQKKLEELNADPAFAEKLRQARRAAEASQLLASAQAAEAAQDMLKAYRTSKQLADNFGDLPQGAEAKAKVAAWEGDAEFMARLANLEAQNEAQQWLVLGNNYLVNHLYAQAIEQYTKVLEKHPDTPAAAEARTKLEQARSAQAAEQKAAGGAPAP